MSSNAFGVTLGADPSGRRMVRLGGTVLLLAGIILILKLPLDGTWRILLVVIWVGDCGFGHWRLECGHGQVSRIRLDSDGGFWVVGPRGAAAPSGLVSGSFVCRRFAWLRFALPDGGRHGELLLATRVGSLEWHRFQLIWRLCSDIFGHPRRA